ncbi:S-adenosylmethionine mitochondrial carrier protein isoform X2 [Erpetoichthys calabaricus]|uniref:S-adenosylmethionine mitochondrial carrier protein isoform X2 n=1 Tax=Erpetoichthys calabaricus TaxID=27687 RepID=UPI0010A0826F|nr:S-adenosylmethionine mitochondrial carrier protein isoform X2 [Erpetoichthys calabaricus]
MHRREFTASLVAGGIAGMCVDLVLYPLDTIKTRLQSPQGFFKASGFRGIYAGVPSVAIGSFPSASAFFVTYEYFKSVLSTFSPPYLSPVIHMVSASLGETVACVIRVPTEVVKQRTQASPSTSTYRILLLTLREEGILGLYRGYSSTVLREYFSNAFRQVNTCLNSINITLRFLIQKQKPYAANASYGRMKILCNKRQMCVRWQNHYSAPRLTKSHQRCKRSRKRTCRG